MRGTLLVCALVAAQAKQVPDWVSKLRAQKDYNYYNECEWFIGTIYNEIVDDAFDAPSVTLARQPALAKCRLTRTLSTHLVRGMTAVYAAASRNRADWLAELLARGGDPDARRASKAQGDDDAFPLFVAAQFNHVEAARLLIAAGARQEETMSGQAAINVAANFGHWEIVALLAESRPDLVDFVGVDKWTGQRIGTPLVAAAGGEPYAGEVNAQIAMLPPAQRKSAGVPPLPSEDEADYAKVIWTLVEHGADVNAQETGAPTALIAAAMTGKSLIVEALLGEGADPNKPWLGSDFDGMTPAMIAAKHNHATAIEVLAAHGANLTKATYEPETNIYTGPHHLALAVQALDALAALVSAGVDVCVGPKPGFRDAVIVAMNLDLLDSLRFIVEEAGCPVNTTKAFSPGEGPGTIQPALHAILHDRPEAFRILAAAGADLDTVDNAAGVGAGHDLAPPSLADVAAVASPGILKILKEEYGREPSGFWQVTQSRGKPPRFVPVDDKNATTLPPRGEL